MKWKTITVIKGVLTIAILGAIIVRVGIRAIVEQLAKINPTFLIPIVLLTLLTLGLGAINIFVLAKEIRKKVRWKNILKHYITVWSLSLFVPGKLSDISMVYFLKKEGIEAGKGTAIVILDSLITLLVAYLFAIFGIMVLANKNIKLLISIMAGITLMLMYVIFSKKIRGIVEKRFAKVQHFGEAIDFIVKKKRKGVLQNTAITVVKTLSIYITYYLSFMAIGSGVSVAIIIAVIPLVRLISLIPVTINGLGIKEGTAVYLFGLLGISGGKVLSAFLITTIVTYLLAPIVMLISAVHSHKKRE